MCVDRKYARLATPGDHTFPLDYAGIPLRTKLFRLCAKPLTNTIADIRGL